LPLPSVSVCWCTATPLVALSSRWICSPDTGGSPASLTPSPARSLNCCPLIVPFAPPKKLPKSRLVTVAPTVSTMS
jgi:hypothetical protein